VAGAKTQKKNEYEKRCGGRKRVEGKGQNNIASFNGKRRKNLRSMEG